jgi:hypothetical protein
VDEFDESAPAEAFLNFGDFDEGGISRGGERDEEDEIAVAGDAFTAEGHALDGDFDLEAELDWGCGIGDGIGGRHGGLGGWLPGLGCSRLTGGKVAMERGLVSSPAR